MNLASLELCKELYELSGWNPKHFIYDTSYTDNWLRWVAEFDPGTRERMLLKAVPAYDLGYLLRKLPRISEDYWLTVQPVVFPQWCASYDQMDGITTKFESFADTPEDAAAKLAIELFTQGILTKEAGDEK